MPTIYDLKPKFQCILRPLTQTLARVGVTPNQVTMAALLVSVITGVLIALKWDENWPLLLLPLILFVRMTLNAIDGMLAREHGMKTKFGGILNELGDVISDIALYLPFGLIQGIPTILVALIVLLSVIAEMTGILGIKMCGARRYDGPMGKSDRAFLFGALGFVLGWGIKPSWWVKLVLELAIILLVLTIFNRARNSLNTEN